MVFTNKIQKALNFAAKKHDGQIRKSSKFPYIVHPFSVFIILSKYTQDEDVLAAALLHDVLEEVNGYFYEDLKKDFGEKVANIVRGVSEDKDFYDGEDDRETWQERKDKYLANLKNDTAESLLVCAADKIHNLKSMSRIYEEMGDQMWQDFNAPLEKQIWYYGSVIEILKEKLDNIIVNELEEEFNNFEKVITIKKD